MGFQEGIVLDQSIFQKGGFLLLQNVFVSGDSYLEFSPITILCGIGVKRVFVYPKKLFEYLTDGL